MPKGDNRRKRRYLEIAKTAVRNAKLDDFLQFLTVDKLAGDSPTARFYDAYPTVRKRGKVVGGGRAALVEDLKTAAAPASAGDETPVTTATVMRLLAIAEGLGDKEPSEAIDELTEIARADFLGYFAGPDKEGSDDALANDVMLNLMFAAAHSDEDARERLVNYYGAITGEYAATFTTLLLLLGREPIPAVGSADQLAVVVTALFDGFAIRERIDGTGGDLLMGVLFHIVAALTIPVGSEPATAAELLFGASGTPADG